SEGDPEKIRRILGKEAADRFVHDATARVVRQTVPHTKRQHAAIGQYPPGFAKSGLLVLNEHHAELTGYRSKIARRKWKRGSVGKLPMNMLEHVEPDSRVVDHPLVHVGRDNPDRRMEMQSQLPSK